MCVSETVMEWGLQSRRGSNSGVRLRGSLPNPSPLSNLGHTLILLSKVTAQLPSAPFFDENISQNILYRLYKASQGLDASVPSPSTSGEAMVSLSPTLACSVKMVSAACFLLLSWSSSSFNNLASQRKPGF